MNLQSLYSLHGGPGFCLDKGTRVARWATAKYRNTETGYLTGGPCVESTEAHSPGSTFHIVRASARGTGLVGDAPVGTIKPRNGGCAVLVVNISGRWLYLCAASALNLEMGW